ncbi:alpha/beta-hydrolase [Agrocybe pediades]|nr:alpha/beta-hydrolase [Agrocybe pediades]
MSTTTNFPGLPSAIKSRFVDVLDLEMHILEAWPPTIPKPPAKPPLLILLHGFPELAYSWRKVMVPLAKSGYVVVAPDLRGYGQTRQKARLTSKKVAFEEDLAPYRILNIVTDVVALVYALGYSSAQSVFGHDFGSAIAAHCSLVRPDLFRSLVMMSAPFSGTPTLSSASSMGDFHGRTRLQKLDEGLRRLDPPKKHYMVYFSSKGANAEMTDPPQGLHQFMRAYYHMKSADWKGNQVHPLGTAFTPQALSVLPAYYIMPAGKSMSECVGPEAPSAEDVAANKWLTEEELAVYVSHYTRSGFQGGLNYYRCGTESPRWVQDLNVFMGKQIEVPAMFISGAQDWGVFQFPGAAEAMRTTACKQMQEEDFVLIEGAGHWVQQEQPDVVVQHLLRFLNERLTS